MVRKDLPVPARETLCALLERSLAEGWSQVDRIIAPRGAGLHMTIAEMRDYLESFRFRATGAEHAAMAKFRELDSALRVAAPVGEERMKA
jgi:hypothetical protein